MSETIEPTASLPTDVADLHAMIAQLQAQVSLGAQTSQRTSAERQAAAAIYAAQRSQNEKGYNDNSRIYCVMPGNPKQVKDSGPTMGHIRYQIWVDYPGITFREYKEKLKAIGQAGYETQDMTHNLKRGLIRVEN